MQIIWVVPHPVDIETYLYTHLFYSSTFLNQGDMRTARISLNTITNYSKCRKNIKTDSLQICFFMVPNFCGFGSRWFTLYCTVHEVGQIAAPLTNIPPMIPVATCDEIHPTKKSVYKKGSFMYIDAQTRIRKSHVFQYQRLSVP